jgi:hypothetical protein
MTRVRSPNYPQLSLSEAVARVAQVFAKEHKHATPKEVVMKHLGYSGVNGASLGSLSALGKYGLLERDGEHYRVSDLAIMILHPESSDEKARGLREALMGPALFKEIFDAYGGVLPSDENLKAYLIRRGFAQSAVGNVIQVLRDSVELVGPPASTYTAPTTSKSAEQGMQGSAMGGAPQASAPAQVHNMPSQKEFRVSLTDEGLQITAHVPDRRGIDRLVAILQANRVLLPEVEDTGRPQEHKGSETGGSG